MTQQESIPQLWGNIFEGPVKYMILDLQPCSLDSLTDFSSKEIYFAKENFGRVSL